MLCVSFELNISLHIREIPQAPIFFSNLLQHPNLIHAFPVPSHGWNSNALLLERLYPMGAVMMLNSEYPKQSGFVDYHEWDRNYRAMDILYSTP